MNLYILAINPDHLKDTIPIHFSIESIVRIKRTGKYRRSICIFLIFFCDISTHILMKILQLNNNIFWNTLFKVWQVFRVLFSVWKREEMAYRY